MSSKLEKIIVGALNGELEYKELKPCAILDNPNYADVKDALEVMIDLLVEAIKDEIENRERFETPNAPTIAEEIDLAYSTLKKEIPNA